MEDMDFLDVPLIDTGDMKGLLFRFVFNAFFIWIIIHRLYYPKSRRRDYYFTFALISVSIFLLIYLLGSVKIKVGFALGLFAIFGIIRYRTESMSVREMTYLFVIIAVSVINALSITLSYAELLLTNVIFLGCIWACENYPRTRRAEKLVLYDRVELASPERREELLQDLRERLGLDVTEIEVGAVDFLHDTVMCKIYYDDPAENSVNRLMKIPKENR